MRAEIWQKKEHYIFESVCWTLCFCLLWTWEIQKSTSQEHCRGRYNGWFVYIPPYVCGEDFVSSRTLWECAYTWRRGYHFCLFTLYRFSQGLKKKTAENKIPTLFICRNWIHKNNIPDFGCRPGATFSKDEKNIFSLGYLRRPAHYEFLKLCNVSERGRHHELWQQQHQHLCGGWPRLC